jgi:hypothetical protein
MLGLAVNLACALILNGAHAHGHGHTGTITTTATVIRRPGCARGRP